MKSTPARKSASSMAGFALIEVVVSALILATVTGGVIRLVGATGKAGAEERHRSQAYSVAQEDQARLRSTRIAELATAIGVRKVPLNGVEYEITSSATSVADKTGTTTCGSGARADYVKLRSVVTWPSMRAGAVPAEIESIVSPVSGSLDPSAGNLSVVVNNGSVPPVPISGVGLSGSGPGSFSGSTDSNGCALFGGQPEGNYTLTPTLDSEYVTPNGKAPAALTVGITSGTTTPLVLEYDKAGTVEVGFTARGSDGVIRPSAADSVTATATGLTEYGGSKVFGTKGGPLLNPVVATPLFPFSYTYNFYGGACEQNKPTAGSANVKAPAGGPAAIATVQLPTLYLNVWQGRNSANKGAAFAGADVWIEDEECKNSSGQPLLRRYVTGATGALTDPGMPSSKYDVCVDTLVTGTTNARRKRFPGTSVKSLTGTSLNAYLGTGTGAESESGSCP